MDEIRKDHIVCGDSDASSQMLQVLAQWKFPASVFRCEYISWSYFRNQEIKAIIARVEGLREQQKGEQ